MSKLYNLARVTTATTGAGTITLGSAVSGYLTFASSGVSDAEIVSYGIKDGANSEVGTGTYTTSGTTLTRTVTKSTNSNTAINLSGTAEVYITARAEDIRDDIGEVKWIAYNRLPANHYDCDGTTIVRVSPNAELYAKLVVSSTVTITNASPGVVTWTGHELQNNDPVFLTTSGGLPTGLSASTKYYVKNKASNTFELAATAGGTSINTSSAGSGTHTGFNAPWEGTAIGNGTTTFTLPNLLGVFPRTIDNGASVDTNRSFGTQQTDALQGHFHSIVNGSLMSSSGGGPEGSSSANQVRFTDPVSTTVGSPTTDGSHGTPRTASETRPTNHALRAVIRYQ